MMFTTAVSFKMAHCNILLLLVYLVFAMPLLLISNWLTLVTSSCDRLVKTRRFWRFPFVFILSQFVFDKNLGPLEERSFLFKLCFYLYLFFLWRWKWTVVKKSIYQSIWENNTLVSIVPLSCLWRASWLVVYRTMSCVYFAISTLGRNLL